MAELYLFLCFLAGLSALFALGGIMVEAFLKVRK